MMKVSITDLTVKKKQSPDEIFASTLRKRVLRVFTKMPEGSQRDALLFTEGMAAANDMQHESPGNGDRKDSTCRK